MLEIRATGFRHPDVPPLVEAVQQFYVELYGNRDDNPIDPAEFDAPHGAFFVGYVDGRPVAMGGWRAHSGLVVLGRTNPAEIRRMYVAADVRGRGFSRAMLTRIEETASAAGHDVMILETGSLQTAAIALYTSAGYVPVDPFGYYRHSSNVVHLGKSLP